MGLRDIAAQLREQADRLHAEAAALERQANQEEMRHLGHRIMVIHQDDPMWHPRRGCLDCNVWLEEARLKR